MPSLLSSFKQNPQYAIEEEATIRLSADNTLQSSISTEVSARQSADTVLQNNINAEVTSRVNAINALQTSVDSKVNSSVLGVTVATLVGGTVPVSQLPSYVDDVVEYNTLSAFPATGESGKIYIAKDTNKTYRWSGSSYVYITSGAVDSVNGKTGAVTLTKADVGLGSVDNIADSSRNVLSATKLTTPRTISVSGDATGSVSFDGSANANITATLANSGVGAGSYRYVAVDAKGRVVGGSNPTTLGGYGITDAYPNTGGALYGNIYVSSPSEPQVHVSLPGYDTAYMFSNSSTWGLYSGAGGAIIQYNRSNGRVYVGGVDTSAIVQNNSGTYSINITGTAGAVAWGNVTGKPSIVLNDGGTYSININGTAASVSSVPVSVVLAANSGASYGAVGSYVFASYKGGAVYNGATYPGGSLRPSGVSTSQNIGDNDAADGTQSNVTVGPSNTLTGTWRAMGADTWYPEAVRLRSTLFIRIA